jgi:hypothetical protein
VSVAAAAAPTARCAAVAALASAALSWIKLEVHGVRGFWRPKQANHHSWFLMGQGDSNYFKFNNKSQHETIQPNI